MSLLASSFWESEESKMMVPASPEYFLTVAEHGRRTSCDEMTCYANLCVLVLLALVHDEGSVLMT